MNPKYSVGDAFCHFEGNQMTTKILHIYSENNEVYYCVSSLYEHRPPNYISESNLDAYFTKMPAN